MLSVILMYMCTLAQGIVEVYNSFVKQVMSVLH